MYIYKKTDVIVPEYSDSIFENDFEKNKVLGVLLKMLSDRNNLVNVRRHIETCEICKPPQKMYILDMLSGEKTTIGTADLVINIEGTTYILTTRAVHNIQIHGYRPFESFVKAIIEKVDRME